jgi:aspartate/methionine/tyrosine aminotransferase
LLSPDNPTGAVYPREILESIAEIARTYKLFLIADEIYAHIVYNGHARLHMSQWVGDVPALAMRGISKEYPWPGSRCGWLEILNKDKDENFATYTNSLLAAKRLEVSSTTLPQMSIPRVVGDPRYQVHLDRRAAMFEKRVEEAVGYFKDCDAVIVNKPCGAFYLTVMFRDGVLNNRQSLTIDNPTIKTRIEELVKNVSPDKRFVYYLMGATGIVVVPLTGFQCEHEGFRVTLLETDNERRAWVFRTLRDAIDEYLAS